MATEPQSQTRMEFDNAAIPAVMNGTVVVRNPLHQCSAPRPAQYKRWVHRNGDIQPPAFTPKVEDVDKGVYRAIDSDHLEDDWLNDLGFGLLTSVPELERLQSVQQYVIFRWVNHTSKQQGREVAATIRKLSPLEQDETGAFVMVALSSEYVSAYGLKNWQVEAELFRCLVRLEVDGPKPAPIVLHPYEITRYGMWRPELVLLAGAVEQLRSMSSGGERDWWKEQYLTYTAKQAGDAEDDE